MHIIIIFLIGILARVINYMHHTCILLAHTQIRVKWNDASTNIYIIQVLLFCKISLHKILLGKFSILANKIFTIFQVLLLLYLFSGPLAFTSWGWTNHFPMRTNPRWRRHLQKHDQRIYGTCCRDVHVYLICSPIMFNKFN